MLEQCYCENVLYVAVKNQDLLKEQQEKGISSLGLKTPLSKIPLFGDILF